MVLAAPSPLEIWRWIISPWNPCLQGKLAWGTLALYSFSRSYIFGQGIWDWRCSWFLSTHKNQQSWCCLWCICQFLGVSLAHIAQMCTQFKHAMIRHAGLQDCRCFNPLGLKDLGRLVGGWFIDSLLKPNQLKDTVFAWTIWFSPEKRWGLALRLCAARQVREAGGGRPLHAAERGRWSGATAERGAAGKLFWFLLVISSLYNAV